MDINKQTLRAFRGDFAKAVAELEKQYGVNIELGNISFSANEFRSKMTVKNGAATKTPSFTPAENIAVGDRVTVNHKKTTGKIFTVRDIKRVTAVVTDESGVRFKVALSMLGKA